MFSLEFCGEVNHEETRVMGLSYTEDRSSLSRFDTVPACDGQTDRQTDWSTIASTALCIASYADALVVKNRGQCSNRRQGSNKRRASMKRRGFEVRVLINAGSVY